MINVLFLISLVQLTFSIMLVNGMKKSQPQQYQGYFNGPQNFHPQQSINGQKWYYSSNQQPLSYAWSWINQDVPSSNYFKNVLSANEANPLLNWACGRTPTAHRFARIMGGQDAVPHSYPWMVSITKRSLNNLHLCGGVLITHRHVLTAAHCMEDFDGPSDLNVIAGTHYITDKRNPIPAIALTIHPQYEPGTFVNDIAVVTLRSSMPENDPRVGTICLPPDEAPSKTNPLMKITAVATGWGSTYFGGDPSPTLKQVALPILDPNKWPCSVYSTYAPGQICAGELSGGVDTCQADSGGPLMLENPDGRWEVIGITSFGKSCGKPNTPGIYTRVSTYNSFIRSIVDLSRHSSYYSSSSSSNRFSFSIILFLSIISILKKKR